MSVRLQPNHPFDDLKGTHRLDPRRHPAGSGDACIGINPASDDPKVIGGLVRLLDEIIVRLQIPTQGCVLAHVDDHAGLIEQGMPVDLVFQSIAGHGSRQPQFRDRSFAAAAGP